MNILLNLRGESLRVKRTIAMILHEQTNVW